LAQAASEYHGMDAGELFDLLLDLREFIALWRKAREGKASSNERAQLGRMVKNLAQDMNILPLRGRLLQHLLPRKPVILPKRSGIPVVVDKLLDVMVEYLNYRYDHEVWEEIRKNAETIKEYMNRNRNRRQLAHGFIFELIARRWLKSARGEHWGNVQRIQILTPPELTCQGIQHGIEVDAFSMMKSNQQLNVAIAEMEIRLTNSATADEIATKAVVLAKYFKRYLRREVNYVEIALIGCRRLPTGEKNDLRRLLRESVRRELTKHNINYSEDDVNVYDVDDMLRSVGNQKNEPDLAKLINYISSNMNSC